MRQENRIPPVHRAIVEAAVKAALGENAVVREIVEVPAGPSLKVRAVALNSGVRTFWSRWSERQWKREPMSDETQG